MSNKNNYKLPPTPLCKQRWQAFLTAGSAIKYICIEANTEKEVYLILKNYRICKTDIINLVKIPK